MTIFSTIIFAIAILGYLSIKFTELVFRAKGHPNFQKVPKGAKNKTSPEKGVKQDVAGDN
jgi:hypothetical protein